MRIRIVLLVLAISIVCTCSTRLSNDDWLEQLPKPWTLTAEEFDPILTEFHQRYPDFTQRLRAFAIWRVGTPYEIFKLGEEVEPDPDPILRYDVSDCTGHNLTSLAAAKSRSWEETRANMIDIHYKADSEGKKSPTYTSRWHYTVDRITANPYTVDITQTLLPREQLDSVRITLNRKLEGGEFLDLDWQREMTAYYIPNRYITPELLAQLPAICGVAFVKEKYFKLGIVMGHEGMIIDGKDVLHASQSAGETVRLDFIDYYFPEGGAFHNGIMIYEFRENTGG